MKGLFALIFLLLIQLRLSAQETPYYILDTIATKDYVAVWYVRNGETEVTATHAQIDIKANYKSRSQKAAYTKLQKKVIKVYPYARAAGEVMQQYEMLSAQVSEPRQKRELLKKAEDQMKAQFEKDLRDMTVSEGVILIKLIDRQTGESSYELVRELKGKMSAFMWQGVARVFGHDLKSEYEAEGDDVWIENTIELIENGTIPVALKKVKPIGS
jgi:hypothetical protein